MATTPQVRGTHEDTDSPLNEAIMADEEHYPITFPALEFGQNFNVKAIRDHMEQWYLAIIYLTNAIVFAALLSFLVLFIRHPDSLVPFVPMIIIFTIFAVFYWVSFKLFYYYSWQQHFCYSPSVSTDLQNG